MGAAGGEERPDEAAAMSAGQQAAFGDGVVGGAEGGQADPGERRKADGAPEAGRAGERYDGREPDHSGLVGGGPADATDAAGGSRAGAGEVAADRARARDAEAASEEPGTAPGESD
jgi:hypothetical protein